MLTETLRLPQGSVTHSTAARWATGKRALQGQLTEGAILWGQGGVVALILISQAAGTYAGAAILLALTLWASRNPRCALQALTISVPVIFANRALVGSQPSVGLLKWVLLFTALGTILAAWKHQPGRMPAGSGAFALFVGVTVGLAAGMSENASLSLLKLGTFCAGVTVALLGVRDQRTPPQYWLRWLTTVSAVVLILSAPFQFLSAGRDLNGFSFQGIFSHPQSYAVYVVPATVYWTVALFGESRGSWLSLALLPWAWYSIFASGCRTAVLAAGLSTLTTIACIAVFPRARRGFRHQRSRALMLCCAALLVVGITATSSSALFGAIGTFLTKGDQSDTIGSSRLAQVQKLLSSIDARVLTGVGFGLAPAGVEQETQVDELTGLPIGAHTEQGFLPLAVLVQLGVIGAVPLTLFLGTLAWPVMKHAPPAVLGLFWTALFVNLGEMIFFSIGGLGLHMWLLVAGCVGASQSDARARKTRTPITRTRKICG
jgi:hypothetical protein